MKREYILYIILTIICILIFTKIENCYAKYVYCTDAKMNVLIDKTPPDITITYYKKENTSKIIETFFGKNLICYCDESMENNEIVNNKIVNNKIVNNEVVNNEVVNNEVVNNEVVNNEVVNNEVVNNEVVKNEIVSNEVEEIIEYSECSEIKPMLASASYSVGVGNEMEFYNNFYNYNVGEITSNTNIVLNSAYTLNHSIKINEGGHALQLASNACIVIPNGCTLILNEVVVDGRSFGNNAYKNCIYIQKGGTLMLTGHSIIDGGSTNTGIYIEDGGNLQIESCQVSYCNAGIILTGNSNCEFASSAIVNTYGYTGKTIDVSYNKYGIYVGSTFCGNLNINHYSGDGEKDNIEFNTYGIFCENHSGNVTVHRARIVYNDWAIYNYGNNMILNNINGGFNKIGLANYGGNITLNGANFYGNSSSIMEYGIYNYSGTINFFTGVIQYNKIGIWNRDELNIYAENILYNSQYDIYNCSISNKNGGLCIKNSKTYSGNIYLEKDENYIYVGEYLPTFTSITVANKFNNRKIIKCSSSSGANTMKGQINVVNREKYNYVQIENNNEFYVVLNNQKNVAIVNFNDSISKIKSAKYWYNENSKEFSGDGKDVVNGQEFDDYGYYKIVVINEKGLESEKTFLLNNDI